MMKKIYRFDYIKEMVEKWAPGVPRTYQQINFLPWRITLPWIMPDCFIPAKDYYGEVIEDLEEWHRQREEYIKNLVKEYEKY